VLAGEWRLNEGTTLGGADGFTVEVDGTTEITVSDQGTVYNDALNLYHTVSDGTGAVSTQLHSASNAGDKGFLLWQDDSANHHTAAAGTENGRLTLGVHNDISDAAGEELWFQGGSRLVQNVGAWDAEIIAAIGAVGGSLGAAHNAYEWRVGNTAEMVMDVAGSVGINNSDPAAGTVLDVTGTTRLGDSTTDYLEVSGTTGQITYTAAAKPRRSVILTAASAITPASGASVDQTDGTNFSYYSVGFADATADEYATWQFVVPDSYDGGTVDITLSWLSTSVSGGNVRWQVGIDSKSTAELFDSALNTTAAATGANVTEDQLNTTTFTGVTSGWTGSQVAIVKVSRLANSDVLDTLVGDAKLVQVKIEWSAAAESD